MEGNEEESELFKRLRLRKQRLDSLGDEIDKTDTPAAPPSGVQAKINNFDVNRNRPVLPSKPKIAAKTSAGQESKKRWSKTRNASVKKGKAQPAWPKPKLSDTSQHGSLASKESIEKTVVKNKKPVAPPRLKLQQNSSLTTGSGSGSGSASTSAPASKPSGISEMKAKFENINGLPGKSITPQKPPPKPKRTLLQSTPSPTNVDMKNIQLSPTESTVTSRQDSNTSDEWVDVETEAVPHFKLPPPPPRRNRGSKRTSRRKARSHTKSGSERNSKESIGRKPKQKKVSDEWETDSSGNDSSYEPVEVWRDQENQPMDTEPPVAKPRQVLPTPPPKNVPPLPVKSISEKSKEPFQTRTPNAISPPPRTPKRVPEVPKHSQQGAKRVPEVPRPRNQEVKKVPDIPRPPKQNSEKDSKVGASNMKKVPPVPRRDNVWVQEPSVPLPPPRSTSQQSKSPSFEKDLPPLPQREYRDYKTPHSKKEKLNISVPAPVPSIGRNESFGGIPNSKFTLNDGPISRSTPDLSKRPPAPIPKCDTPPKNRPPPLPPRTEDRAASPSLRSEPHLGTSVPPPLQPRTKDGQVLTKAGYLSMDRNATMNRSMSDPYIDPESVPSNPVASTNLNSQVAPPSPESGKPVPPYLQLQEEEEKKQQKNYDIIFTEELGDEIEEVDDRCNSIFKDEPLYQVYSYGVNQRGLHRMMGSVSEDDSDDDYEDAATVVLDSTSFDAEAMATLKRTFTSTSGDGQKKTSVIRTLWSETDIVKNSGKLRHMTQKEKNLQEAYFEIISSEASYVKSLRVLRKVFLNAPEFTLGSPECCVTALQRNHLFSNISAVTNISEQMMELMEDIWNEDFMLSTNLLVKMKEFAEAHFEPYVHYCSNQVYQERTLKEIRQNPKVAEIIDTLEQSQACVGLSLVSFFILPMQRVTRMPLLIDAVCHRLDPTKKEYEAASEALSAFQRICKQCNEGARQMENLEEMIKIDKMLEYKGIKKKPLVSVARSVVKKGELTKINPEPGGFLSKKKEKEKLYIFLFNDMLLVTKKKNEDTLQVLDYSPKINVDAYILTDEQINTMLPNSKQKNIFMLVLLEDKDRKAREMYFSCESISERARWVDAVTPADHQDEDDRIYEEWDCPQEQAIHKYEAVEPDELSLEESDVINVSRKLADGWYYGERIRDGRQGWFPNSYTEEITSAHMRAKNLRQRYRLLHTAFLQHGCRVSNAAKSLSPTY